jgi:predicted nucleotidyltransferase
MNTSVRAIEKGEAEPLFGTIVGSHMWGMETPESDVDSFYAYVARSVDILTGEANTDSYHVMEDNKDRAYHEIGKVVQMMLKGNVNFLWGILSPIVLADPQEELRRLKMLTMEGLSQRVFHSINGLARANYKKYIASGKDPSQKRLNLIARTLEFGVHLLDTGEPRFQPVTDATEERIIELLEELGRARDSSPLPVVPPNEDDVRKWLLRIRMVSLAHPGEWK